MKKSTYALFLVLALSLMLSVPAFAADTTTYTLDELYMKVDLPSDLMVITRDTSESDPNLATLGVSKQELIEYFQAHGIFLITSSMDDSLQYEIGATSNESSKKIFNYNLYDEDALNDFMDSFKESATDLGHDITNYMIYHGKTATYFSYDLKTEYDGSAVYGRMLSTCYNGQYIMISASSAKQFTAVQQKELLGIADSIVFTKKLPTPFTTYITLPSFHWVMRILTIIIGTGIGLFISSKRKKNKASASAADFQSSEYTPRDRDS